MGFYPPNSVLPPGGTACHSPTGIGHFENAPRYFICTLEIPRQVRMPNCKCLYLVDNAVLALSPKLQAVATLAKIIRLDRVSDSDRVSLMSCQDFRIGGARWVGACSQKEDYNAPLQVFNPVFHIRALRRHSRNGR
jgi:hypothetical protein